MNPSTAMARVLVDELVRCGVTEAVLSPGSRNAPLAFALYDADAADRLRLHVRIDERSAGFLALGLAKVSRAPVLVTCTSGTAAANLLPAVLEASHSAVPLIVATADRPAELQGTGANQTTDQVGLYGAAVRLAAYLPAAADVPAELASARAVVDRLAAAARGSLGGEAGPVHLDVAFREPLVPGNGPEPVDPGWRGRAAGAPWTAVAADVPAGVGSEVAAEVGPDVGRHVAGEVAAAASGGGGHERAASRVGGAALPVAGPGLMVVGDCEPALAVRAGRVAARRGWPVVAEPTGWAAEGALAHGSLLLADGDWLDRHRPASVVVVGRPTLSRSVQRLLADPRIEVLVVTASGRWADPGRAARRVLPAAALESLDCGEVGGEVGDEPGRSAYLAAWRRASERAGETIAKLGGDSWPSGPALARELVAALPGGTLLFLGSSSPIRDVDLAATPRSDLSVLANRGLAGIDGTVSSAMGAALADQVRGAGVPAVALAGDLTFLHDATGLLAGSDEPVPEITYVVANDNGGAIFSLLEQGRPEHSAAFERVFGTPQRVDLGRLCAATATPHEVVSTASELVAALRQPDATPRRVLEVRLDRGARSEMHERMRRAIRACLSE